MTQKTTITLVDSASTPESPGTPAAANRVFTPGAMEQGYIHTWSDTTTGTTPDTKSKMTIGYVPANGSTRPVSRLKIQFAIPKAQTVDGIVKRAHVNRAFVEFVFDKDSTRDDRRDIKSLVGGILSATGVNEMVSDGEDFY